MDRQTGSCSNMLQTLRILRWSESWVLILTNLVKTNQLTLEKKNFFRSQFAHLWNKEIEPEKPKSFSALKLYTYKYIRLDWTQTKAPQNSRKDTIL